MNTFGKRLRYFRDSINLSQDEMAEITGMSRGAISKAEGDKTRMEKYSIEKIYHAFPWLNQEWLEHGIGEMGKIPKGYKVSSERHVAEVNDQEPSVYRTPAGRVMVDATDLFATYYDEIDLISKMLNKKQSDYSNIIDNLRKLRDT